MADTHSVETAADQRSVSADAVALTLVVANRDPWKREAPSLSGSAAAINDAIACADRLLAEPCTVAA